jgi:mannosidase alpha-like ER degradation enhancer 2
VTQQAAVPWPLLLLLLLLPPLPPCPLQDNLLPRSCRGQDWQGGMALTLVDSLDALLLLNRRGDMEEAARLLRGALTFDKDIKVWV